MSLLKSLIITSTLLAATVLHGQSTPLSLTSPAVSSIEVEGVSGAVVDIYTSGDVLMQGFDTKQAVVFTLYRDGHVQYADKRKVEESTRQFWAIMAQEFRKTNPRANAKQHPHHAVGRIDAQ